MKLPRKLKKKLLGKKLSKTKLKKLLSCVEVIRTAKTMCERPFIKPYLFCPKCGCRKFKGTGNMTSSPEHWEYFHCLRCNNIVAAIDNSPFIHILEMKDFSF